MDPEMMEMPPLPKPKKGKGKAKSKAKKSKAGKCSKVEEVEAPPTEEVVPPGANDCEDPAEEVLPPGADDCVDPAEEVLPDNDKDEPKHNRAKAKGKAKPGKRKSERLDGDAEPVVKKARAGDAQIPSTFARRYMPAKPGFSRERWQAIRIAFNKNIYKKFAWPSKHEDFK